MTDWRVKGPKPADSIDGETLEKNMKIGRDEIPEVTKTLNCNMCNEQRFILLE